MCLPLDQPLSENVSFLIVCVTFQFHVCHLKKMPRHIKKCVCTSIISVRFASFMSEAPSESIRLQRVPEMFTPEGWGFVENVDICVGEKLCQKGFR